MRSGWCVMWSLAASAQRSSWKSSLEEQSSRASSSEGAVITSGPPAIEQTSSVKRYLSDASVRFASSGIFTVRSLSSASTSRSQKRERG